MQPAEQDPVEVEHVDQVGQSQPEPLDDAAAAARTAGSEAYRRAAAAACSRMPAVADPAGGIHEASASVSTSRQPRLPHRPGGLRGDADVPTTMLIAGALCRRLGSERVAVGSCALLSVTLVLPALARSATTLGLALLVFGAAYGCLNVAMNSIAVDLVAALRRPVMPGFHAAWSFGGLAGAALGGLLAPHLSPVRDLLLVALAGLVSGVAGHILLASARWLPAGPARPTRESQSSRAWRQVLMTAGWSGCSA